jgi:colanic acid biosynthesis glycosyl transferase WcaI
VSEAAPDVDGLRVTFLTHYFPPEAGAAQTRIEALARGLALRGAQVTVHTGFPHYPDGRIKAPYANRPLTRERLDGLLVVRSAVHAAPNRGFARRMFSHASFAAGAVATAPFTPGADVVIVHSPPLPLGGAGIAYAALKRAPYVLHVSDLYPESAIELGALRNDRAVQAARWLETACYARAAAITAPTEGIVERLSARPEVRLAQHMNPLVELERFDGEPRRHGGRLRVLYAGTLGLAHRVQTLVEAAILAGPDNVELWIAGDGQDADVIRDLVASSAAQHVKLLGLVPAESIPALYAAADVAAVVLRDRPLFRDALPSKTFEAMAAARPVVLSGAGEAARLVERHDIGLVVPPEDPAELAEVFIRLAGADESVLTSYGARGRALAERYSLDQAVNRWCSLLDQVSRG